MPCHVAIDARCQRRVAPYDPRPDHGVECEAQALGFIDQSLDGWPRLGGDRRSIEDSGDLHQRPDLGMDLHCAEHRSQFCVVFGQPLSFELHSRAYVAKQIRDRSRRAHREVVVDSRSDLILEGPQNRSEYLIGRRVR
ncbi:hypothetical protein YM304_06220 [Ilumatobacter coccineus YM16-304]|uniref:Uncharacterized protein n=1 Tax=Ilumatobacter coccineus (strain NBRC 103263 / KCTC 29153 / YM16-304) TaxID=1313172 RepID=A0A6C7EA70_ILUCY|nr:hypothetical protein YM304_06220 [Ilumatobacter coccineus YM16-304]